MIDINKDMHGIFYKIVWYNNDCTSINRQEGCWKQRRQINVGHTYWAKNLAQLNFNLSLITQSFILLGCGGTHVLW